MGNETLQRLQAEALALSETERAPQRDRMAGKLRELEMCEDVAAVAEARFSLICASGTTVPWREMRRYLEDRVAGKSAEKLTD